MLKKLPFFTFIFFLCGLTAVSAQTPKTVIVEHFTNTRCGICANRNPGFYENLNNHPDVIHLAIHPSSPYSNCLLNNHNPEGNDARTNYYGIYGSTPKLVIQGNLVPTNTNYGNPEIFDEYEGQTAPILITAQLSYNAEDDQYGYSVTIEATEDNNLGEVAVFTALSENTVEYNAPNGEDVHYDVFRQTFEDATGTFTVPATAGESVILNSSAVNLLDGNYLSDNLSITVIVQDIETKEVIQADRGAVSFISGTDDAPILENVSVFPNPTVDAVRVSLQNDTETTLRLTDVTGKLLTETVFRNAKTVSLSNLPQGIYFINLVNAEGRFVQKVVKE